MAKLTDYFGHRATTLQLWIGSFMIGSGAFTTFEDTTVAFDGAYRLFLQSGTFDIRIHLSDAAPTATAGGCKVTMNQSDDAHATYKVDGAKLIVTTSLNDTPVAIYVKDKGTQIDGISGHNLWIGNWTTG